MKLLLGLLSAVFLFTAGPTFAACEAEQSALQQCLDDANRFECRYDSDCASGYRCLSGSCVYSQPNCEWQELTRQERRGQTTANACSCGQYQNSGRKVYVDIQERNTCTNEVRNSSYIYVECDPCP